MQFEGEEATWGAEEIKTSQYEDGENMYIANIPSGKTVDDTEIFDITNTVVVPIDHDPPVMKIVTGDTPKKAETFEFSLTAISKPENVKEFPMPEGSDGNVKIMKVKAGEEKEFGDIVFRIPGVYTYEIREINTGKKGYKYDSTVYKLEYNMTVDSSEDGVYKLHMDRKVYKDGVEVDMATYSFENEYTAPETEEPPTPDKDKPDTGDTNNIVIPAAIFAAALIAFLIMYLKKRKNRKSSDQ